MMVAASTQENFPLPPEVHRKRTDAFVTVQDLSVDYSTASGMVPAVRSVSFTIGRAETFALVGESGSGKSTVAMALLGYLPAGAKRTASRLQIDGTDLETASERNLRFLRGKTVAAVYQNPGSALNPAMTIGRQIAEILEHHQGLSRRRAAEHAEALLDEVQIRNPGSVMARFPHQISGGMQQRVCIAMAIALEPGLIVLDEPTTALDATVQRQVMDLLVDLQRRRGTSYLLISHDIHLVKAYAPRMAVMQAGAIVEAGSCEELHRAPRHPYTQQLLGSAHAARSEIFHLAAVSEKPVLRIENLAHDFQKTGKNAVIRGITLEIAAGETLGLIGESGSGKSTIGKLICGIHDIQTGYIHSEGRALAPRSTDRSKRDRNAIRMVFQSPDMTLNPARSIYTILCRAAEIAGDPEPHMRANQLLDLVRLPRSLGTRRPFELSGGQKQRVAIARAFASKPRLVVLDEPTSALDASVQTEILNLLHDLQTDEKVAYLLITHDLDVVEQLAHRLAVIRNGELVEDGHARQVLGNPVHAYTKQLISSRFLPRLPVEGYA